MEMLVTWMALAFLPHLWKVLGEAGGEKLSPSFPPFVFFIHHQMFFESHLFTDSGPVIRRVANAEGLRRWETEGRLA